MRVEITVTSDPFVNAALDSRDTGLFLLRTIRIRNNGGHIRDAHLRLRTTPFIVEFNSPVDVQIPAGKELTIPVGDLIETSPHWQDLPDTYISKLQVELLTDDGFVRATSDVYNVRLLTGNTWPGCANRDLLAAFVIPDQPSLRRDAEPLGRVVGGTTPEDAAASIVRILRKRKMVRKPLPGDMFRRPYRFVLYEEMTVADGCTSVDMALAFAAMAEAVGLEPVIGVFADGMMVGIRTSPGGTWGDSVVPVDPDLIFGGCRPSEIVARSRKASKGPLDSMVDVASLRDRISPIPMALLEHGMRTYISADTMERKPPLRYLTWMSRLLDISLNNSLLDMGPRTVRFDVSDQGQVDSLQDVLLSGTEVKTRYASPTVGGFDGVRIAMDRSHGDRMEAFRRSIASNIRETGVGGGCVGLGSMHWTDRKGRNHEAPLVLVSADLRKLNEHGYALRHPDLEDAAVNIVLLERLRRETGAVTPRAEEFSSNGRIDITGLASRLSSIPGVGYRPTVVFGEFGLETNEMWRDLESNSRDILSNPLVGRLAECRQLDHMGPLEPDYDMSDLHPVLPVDSSQIAAMNAAVSGRSFVLRGPPGTGKSQTICNIICELVRRRRTVLFVSQKASALEIIHRRLSKIGLGGFCIGVYGKTAKRSAVVEQLRDNLNDRGSDGPPEEVIQSPVSTDALDRYYEAMFGDSGRGDSFYVKYNRYLASLSTESVIPEPGDDAKGFFGSSMEALDSLISGIPDDDLFTMISIRDLSDDLLRGACGMKVNPLRSASKKCREFSEILRRCGIGDEVRIGEIGSLATDLVKLSSLRLKPSDRDAHDRRAAGVRNAVKAVRTACGDVCDLTPGDDVARAMGRLRSALFELMTRNGRSEDVSRHLGTTESLIREIAGTVPEMSWEERMASTDPRTAAIADGVRNSGRNPEELYRMLTYCSDFMEETFPGTDGNPFQHADVMGKLDFIVKEWDSRLSVRDARRRVDSMRGLLDEADRLMGDMETRILEWTPCTDLGGRVSSLLDGCDGMYEDGFMTARLDATGLMKAMLDVFEAGLQYDEAVKASDRIWNKGVYGRLHEYRNRMVSLKGHSVVNRLNGSISEFMREIDGHSRVRMKFGDVSVNLETAMNARRAHDRVLERIVGFGKVREETEGRMSKLLETADRVEKIQGTIPEWRRLLIDGTYSDQKVRKDLEGHC
ncbi:MAG: DUF4011 domain-containing protein, partial [Candidatus Methanomethylophilaceae archaeon]|nr:DUF4011 domain-containing protein [Candidatus Methanomethylophilaceae archaeon]